MALDSLAYLQDTGAIRLHAYVIMIDHLHLIAGGDDLPGAMQRFSSFTARGLVKEMHRLGLNDHLEVFRVHRTDRRKSNSHKVWQTGAHPTVIYSQAVLTQKTQYIHQNPVRAGLVENPTDWPYSSLTRINDPDTTLPRIDPVSLQPILSGGLPPTH